MEFNEIIEDDILIICDNNTKEKILSFLNNTTNLYNIKFITMSEVIKKLFFDYDKQTIYYLMDKYNIPYEIADTYIKNMYYIEDKDYKNDKLNMLVKYKKELSDNNLLIKDDLFIDSIKNKKIKVVMKKISKYNRYVFSVLEKYTNVDIYDFKYNKYNHNVYEFNYLDQEIEYVAYNICDLIKNGIDINKIKISNIDEEYISSIKRIFFSFNIPINLPNNSYIIGSKIGKDFIDNLESDINKTIEKLSEYKDSPIYNLIIKICNKYTFIDDFLKVKDMLIHDLSTTLIPIDKYDNAVEIVDYSDIFDDEYIFLMNFNLNKIPKVYKDEDFITDSIKPDYLDTTFDKNKLEKELAINSIDNIKNLIITYKNITPENECYPSNLIENKTIEKPNINIYKSYSKLNDKLKLANNLDKLIKYGSKSDDLNILKYNYDIPFMEYDNKYTRIDTNNLYKLLNNKLNFSYTNIQKYNECAFKYYLSEILKIDIYEENFSAFLGTLFHYVLEKGINNEIDIDKTINEFLNDNYKDKNFTKKEMFFIENAKENIEFAIKTIKNQMRHCKLNNIMTEKKVYISKDKNLKITFSGIIDKLLYSNEKNHTIIAIIDYKTSNYIDIDLGYMQYGIGLQLPIYIYLANNMEFKNIKFAGIYIQKVMPDIGKKSKETKESKLKLEGYSNSSKDIIDKFDSTYNDSDVIKGLKTKDNGEFSAYSKVLSNDEFNSLSDLANKKIDEVIDNVLDANFDINPISKEEGDKVDACEFCSFKDVCFRKNDDIRNLKKDKDLSFLGGDIND